MVGCPHDIKGNGLYCYVTLNVGVEPNGDLERELKNWVKKKYRSTCSSRFYSVCTWTTKNKIWKNNEKNFKKDCCE